jgi:hypothetical protein
MSAVPPSYRTVRRDVRANQLWLETLQNRPPYTPIYLFADVTFCVLREREREGCKYECRKVALIFLQSDISMCTGKEAVSIRCPREQLGLLSSRVHNKGFKVYIQLKEATVPYSIDQYLSVISCLLYSETAYASCSRNNLNTNGQNRFI